MGFWDNKVGQQARAQAPEPVAQTSAQPWYQLTTSPAPSGRAVAAQTQGMGAGTANAQATHNAQSGRCPHCDSTNYLDVSTHPESKFPMGAPHLFRCFDCGYPKTQTGTGSGGGFGIIQQPVQTEGPVQQARQVTKAGNWNPSGWEHGIGIQKLH